MPAALAAAVHLATQDFPDLKVFPVSMVNVATWVMPEKQESVVIRECKVHEAPRVNKGHQENKYPRGSYYPVFRDHQVQQAFVDVGDNRLQEASTVSHPHFKAASINFPFRVAWYNLPVFRYNHPSIGVTISMRITEVTLIILAMKYQNLCSNLQRLQRPVPQPRHLHP